MATRKFILITASAFILRIIYLILVGGVPEMYLTPDSSGYVQLAVNLAVHHEFSNSESPPLTPETVRTPGYPAFLMPFVEGEKPHILRIVLIQSLLGAITAGFLFLTSNELWKKNTAAVTSGLGMAFDYVIIVYSSFIMTEALFMFLSVLSLFLFARFLKDPDKDRWSLAFAGIVSGLCTLVRPVGLFYFVIPTIVLLYMGATRKIRNVFLPLVILLVTSVSPPFLWMARNKNAIGSWTISTIQGLTRAAILEERLSHTSYKYAAEIVEGKFKQEHPNAFSSSAAEASEKSSWATAYVLRYPKDYSIVLLQETVRLLAGNGMKVGAWLFFKDPGYNPYTIVDRPTDSNRSQALQLASKHPVLGLSLVLYLSLLALVYVFALFGFFTAWEEFRPSAIWLALTIMYFSMVSIGFGACARYRIPLMPAIFLLAGLGFEEAIKKFFVKENI